MRTEARVYIVCNAGPLSIENLSKPGLSCRVHFFLDYDLPCYKVMCLVHEQCTDCHADAWKVLLYTRPRLEES